VRHLLLDAASALQVSWDAPRAPGAASQLPAASIAADVVLPMAAASFARVAAGAQAASFMHALPDGFDSDGGAEGTAPAAALARLRVGWGDALVAAPAPAREDGLPIRAVVRGHALLVALLDAVRAQAVLESRTYVTPDDIHAIMWACCHVT